MSSTPRPPFPNRSRIRVVLEADRQTKLAVHVVAKRKVGQRKIHALDDDAAPLVDRRRHAESDRLDLILHELGDGCFELTDDGFLGVLGRCAFVTANDFPVPRDDAGKDFRASEVNTDRLLCAHVQRVP